MGCSSGGGDPPPGGQAGGPDVSTPEVDAGPDGSDEPACVEYAMPADVDCGAPLDGVLPVDLRCTGLYGDFDERELACGVLEYKPAMELWSDGAAKRRFVSIPKGQRVDVSNPDAFVYPEGTQFWKEFRVKGADGALRMAETRLLRKMAAGWVYTSYVWSEDERQAIQMQNDFGVPDLYGTGHMVPTRDQCKECHVGRADFVLGWDALMLGPGAEGVTRESLVALGVIEDASPLALTIPGDEVERQALGYLHANCGVSCHNDLPESAAHDTGLYLRLEAGELGSVAATDAVQTGMNKRPAENAKYEGLKNPDPANWYDIRPGDPSRSLLVARQELRGFEGQMPRIATRQVDNTGLQLVTQWIQGMTEPNYPPPGP
ncbi:hypothetical protein SCE1572_18425 [Sorangium cellulosum So0157-2]|uniref:Cytochrome c domain-containing protein n=3 Tax=Sorangium cellulosum TaxID=56 RepID=S4XSX9_SORCE|nr:hypothetical protein SCE1572_18425 [Sorangium cellulosum So0157-2]